MTTIRRAKSANTSYARFANYKAEPSRAHGLPEDHAAVVEGRTLFPTRVTATKDAPRLLIGGENNAKIGRHVTKGRLKGMRIYTLTLEERATCPRSCAVWKECYGNGMQWPRRHAADADLIPRLREEVAALAAKHPVGFLVRLHVLGDFYSVAYVQAWAEMLKAWPELHVFGFTARSEMDDDAESREIASAIADLGDRQWERFAIRFSRPFATPQGAMMVEADPHRPNIIVCPAQTEMTHACGTCGLCWATPARDKTIAFLKHGLKTPGKGPRKPKESLPMKKPHRSGAGTRQIHFIVRKPVYAPETPTTIFGRPVNPAPSPAHQRLAQFDPVVARAIGAPAPDLSALVLGRR